MTIVKKITSLAILFILLGCASNIARYRYVEYPHGNQKLAVYDNKLYYYEQNWGLGYGYAYGTIEWKGDTLLLFPPSDDKFHIDSIKVPLNDSTSFTFMTNHPKTKVPPILDIYRNGQKIDGKLLEWNKQYKYALQPNDSLEISSINNAFSLTLNNPFNMHYTVFHSDYHDELSLIKDTIIFVAEGRKLTRVRNNELTHEVFEHN